jgi:hypothetical protein
VWSATQCVFDMTEENNQSPFVKLGRDVNERCVSRFSVNWGYEFFYGLVLNILRWSFDELCALCSFIIIKF